MRLPLIVGTALLLATGAFAQAPRPDPAGATVEKVDVQAAARPLGGLLARKMRERGEEPKPTPGSRIEAYLARPRGDGPFPAVVILPDCVGLTPFMREALPARLASWGYVALVVDSWTSRNAQAGCLMNGQEPPGVDRVADAYGALFYLASLPSVDRNRVAVLGFATGGVFVLTLAEPQTQSSVVNEGKLGFAAGVVFYPSCGTFEARQETAFPLLILVGQDDVRAHARECESMARPQQSDRLAIEVKTYPGVRHGFADPVWSTRKEVFGFEAAYDASAGEDAMLRTREFLNRTTRGSSPP